MTRTTWVIGFAVIAQAACSYDPLPPLGSGVAAKLVFVKQPAAGIVQQPLDEIRVAVRDEQGKELLRADNQITLALGNNPAGAQLRGQLTATARAGTASFTVVGLDKPAAGYTLVASTAGLTSATSEPFTASTPAFAVVPSGPFGGEVVSVAISPAPSGGATTIFASVGNGVYKSVNRGAAWTPASFGLVNAPGILVADPRTPGVVYGVRGGGGFLKKTTTNGDTWLDVGNETTGGSFAAAVDPMNPAILYSCTSGLFRSTDGGASWKELTSFPLSCSRIAVDPIATSSVYALTYDAASSRGVYRSRDSGVTWMPVSTGLTALDGLVVLVSAPGALFAGGNSGLFRSTDGGDHWNPVAVDSATALAYAPSAPTRMYLARASQGVSVSDDTGDSFGAPVDLGAYVRELAVDPTNQNLVYAGADKGMYVSTDGGATWSFSSTGITAQYVRSVAMVPTIPDTVVVATNSGVFQTSNGGTSWTQASALRFGIVRFDPTTPTRAYLCSSGGEFSTSTSSGASFGASASAGTNCAQLAVAGNTLFAAGSGGTYKSINGGADWTTTDTGAGYSLSVALGDTVGNVVITGTSKGIARSINGGTSYDYVSSAYVGSLLSDPAMPTRVIAGLACGATNEGAQGGGGFLVSTDGGASFGSRKAGPCVQQLSGNGSTLYAAGSYDESYLSTDHGETWTKLNAPRDLFAGSIAAAADGKTLYLGTSSGLYKSTTGGL